MNTQAPAMRFSLRMQGWVNIRKSINIIYNLIDQTNKKDVTISLDAEKLLDQFNNHF